ncbi:MULTISPECIES: enoyl-CoA hydratase/isomerase family protein [unclassified Photobacterium]|uniref:enoyl-CoA hydratase/isomerase family protein n=1 Tax=unclassified Photobacterium TaxID=2628852 RepID=UPI001EE01AF9|nr:MULTISPECIES: enoyl-CoA hydratase/isomerase family protein [unclassified Photobacterium]MCG3862594.1 enoyl-CoA hydratase/isomerase family protein [Photobacterium sp. Ph6]MCG3874125.1 enoyl-CoA hydratase/isomerase family protein [Photobacterium sp. Ph5]
MTGIVNVSYIRCIDGHKIGVLELDNPSSLNALTLNMHKTMYQYLQLWREDESIVSVIIKSVGDRAFCAGGDVRSMYYAMENDPALNHQQKPPKIPLDQIDSHVAKPFLTEYFSVEYSCNLLIHHYNKPVIAWGHGFIMGGGLGLYIGSSHRVALSNTVLAMPEITIGLYPDVGATWFLNQLPAGIGLFLGLTGAHVNVCDARDLAMVDHIVPNSAYDNVVNKLKHYPWSIVLADIQSQSSVSEAVSTILKNCVVEDRTVLPANQLMPYFAQIQAACFAQSLPTIYDQINAIDGLGLWIETAKKVMNAGSPITAHICFKQIQDYKDASLLDCIKMELGLSVNCGLLGEFKEGVRAHLIDKDYTPQWIYTSVSDVDENIIEQLFTSIWSEHKNPLNQVNIS